MTDAEINARIAEGMGWTNYEGDWHWDTHEETQFGAKRVIAKIDWNPLNSISDAFEVVEKIKEKGLQYEYYLELKSIIQEDTDNKVFLTFNLIHATARQRSLAAIKAIDEET